MFQNPRNSCCPQPCYVLLKICCDTISWLRIWHLATQEDPNCHCWDYYACTTANMTKYPGLALVMVKEHLICHLIHPPPTTLWIFPAGAIMTSSLSENWAAYRLPSTTSLWKKVWEPTASAGTFNLESTLLPKKLSKTRQELFVLKPVAKYYSLNVNTT